MTSRQQLAQQWELVLARAYQSPRSSLWKAPVARPAVVAAGDDIRRLVGLLCGAQPVSAAGITMARRLLTDGSGPLYAVGTRRDLAAAVRATVSLLEAFSAAETSASRRS